MQSAPYAYDFGALLILCALLQVRPHFVFFLFFVFFLGLELFVHLM